MRCSNKIFVLACLFLILQLGLSSIATAQVVVGQIADLSNNHPGASGLDALANPINDTLGNPSWTVGGIDLPAAAPDPIAVLSNGLQLVYYSSLATDPTQIGWTARVDGSPDGYNLDRVGFDATTPGQLSVRTNGNNPVPNGSVVGIEYQVHVAGLYNFDFHAAAPTSITNTPRHSLGLMNVQTGQYIGNDTNVPGVAYTPNAIDISAENVSAQAGDRFTLWWFNDPSNAFFRRADSVITGTTNATIIPETGTLALLATGLVGMLVCARRKWK